MSETEKRTYESQMKINPILQLVANPPLSRRPEQPHQSINLCSARVKVDPAQVEKIDLLNRLIKYLKTL
jgi:hypothetical protein